jgi:Fur family ferric uptake transcriptional regulator
MSEPLDQLKKTLKEHGQSLTEPRLIVFEALQDQEPQTMQQLIAGCKGRVDRASVYRTVALFEKLGISQRLQIGWKYKIELSDSFHHHHHHLTCLRCGQTIPLQADELLEKRLHDLAHAASFQVSGHQVEIQGLCQNCQRLTRIA